MTKKTKDPKRQPESPEEIKQKEIKQKFEQFVKELDELSFPTSPIDLELATWVASAFHLYLDGKAKTLDKAFGLKRGVGRPTDPARKQIALKVFEALEKNKTNKIEGQPFKTRDEVLSELESSLFKSKDALLDALADYINEIYSDDLTARIAGHDKSDDS